MSLGWLKIVLLAAFGLGLAANDYTAEIANGGLRARQETRVAMRSERLFISYSKIRVEYEFVNESSEPVETVVAFPWPGYRWGGAALSTFAPSMLEFSVVVDGSPVHHQTEVRALVGKREITQELKALGVNAATLGDIDENLSADHPWIAAPILAKLKVLGAVGENDWPTWMAFVTHYWTQLFPPGKVVKVVHEYAPIGGSSSYRPLSLIEQPEPEVGMKPGELVERDFDARDPGCPDAAFIRAFKARQKELERDEDIPPRLGLPLGWVRYILTTANTWKGPIRDFELIVGRNPGDLVTFCWDGPVEKIGPDRFRARRQDFRPEKELTVYYVPSLKRGK